MTSSPSTSPARSSTGRFDRKPAPRIGLGSLAAIIVLGSFTTRAARAQDAPQTPWVGERGITETVAQIMERARKNGDDRPRTEAKEIEAQEHEIDRDGLPQAPGSPAVPMWPPPSGLSSGLSPVIAPGPGGTNLPQTVGVSFPTTQLSESGFIPPDTCGSVGPTQVLVCSNGRIKAFDKLGSNTNLLNVSTDSFFTSVRNGSGTSDPQVKYDRLSGRWFVTMCNVSTPNRILLAVSSGSTITNSASFTFYQFQQDTVAPAGNTGQFADYPKVGVDANAIVIGCNMFSGNTYVGTTAWVVRKSSALSGGPIVVTALRGLVPSGGAAGPMSPTGVDNDDPAATVSYIVGVDNAAFGLVVLRRISNPGGSPTVSGNLNVTVPSTTFPINQVALGSTNPLDSLDDRLFAAQIHRNRVTGVTSLWTAHNIQVNSSGVASGSGGRNGSRWYQIDNLGTTPSLTQSGTLFDSAASNPRGYWIPSIAMSGQGHVVLGTSYANATADHAGVATSGRLRTDALGTIQAATLAVVSPGTYNVQNGAGVTQRWGDYSAVMVDPTDDQTLWAFGEYCGAASGSQNNSWDVRAVQLRAPLPATPASANPSTLNPNTTNVNVIITGTSSAGSGFYDTEAGFNRIAAAFSGTGITVNSIVWNSPTQITLNVNVSAGAASGSRDLTVTNPDGQTSSSSGGIVNVATGDCNANGIPDNQDIQNGTSQDCDHNAVPDECQPDTDGDGTINACDGCPNDPAKIAPGQCGCGVADTDTDGDGTANCNDGCPSDPAKIAPGQCGCGVPDTDSDGDGTANCHDGCPSDPGKTAPGQCGCGTPDTDSDGDGTANCNDGCPNDPAKIAPGICGCGAADTDSDGDGTPNCNDGCPNDPAKIAPGLCGCGVADTDSDGDGTPNCTDGCPNDPAKIAPGQCGCGVADTDTDGDGTANCHDGCPSDPTKIAPGQCGCGVPDTDTDGDGTANCNDGCPNDPGKTSPGSCGCGTPDTDTDADGVPDCIDNCDNIANPGQGDCNNDNVGDACEIAAGAPDCNGNFIPDSCDIASGSSLDTNSNGVPDECEGGAMVGFCYPGVGGIRLCPCGNPQVPALSNKGCDNFGPNPAGGTGGATLTSQGVANASISSTLQFDVGNMIAPVSGTITVLWRGMGTISPGFQSGAGVRCVTTNLARIYKGQAFGGAISFPNVNQTTNSWIASGMPASGTTLYYYASYRNAQAGAPCGNANFGFNLTNSGSVTFVP